MPARYPVKLASRPAEALRETRAYPRQKYKSAYVDTRPAAVKGRTLRQLFRKRPLRKRKYDPNMYQEGVGTAGVCIRRKVSSAACEFGKAEAQQRQGHPLFNQRTYSFAIAVTRCASVSFELLNELSTRGA